MKTRKANIANLAVLAATTLVVAACGGGGGGGESTPPPMANNAPAISGITDKIADQDTAITMDFGVEDRESAPGSLTVEATADGNALIPADGVVLSGSGATRTLTLTPLEATTGTTTIAIRVADPQGAETTKSFQVTVNAKNASMKSKVLETYAKGESDTPTVVNGWTAQPDPDDEAAFAALLGEG